MKFSIRGPFFALLILAGFSAKADPIDWGFTTDARFETLLWPTSYGEDTNNTLNRLELVPTLTAKYQENYRLFFKPYLFLDPQNNSPTEKTYIDIGEAYIKYKNDNFTVQVGSNIFNWGVTDGYNPLDVVNMHQYFDPLHPHKLGAPSIVFSEAFEHSEVELTYIPQNRSSQLPGVNSRWLPREIFIPQSVTGAGAELLLPPDLNYSYMPRETLNDALANNVALRYQLHFSNIDIGFYGYNGVANFPLVEPEVTGTITQVSPQTIIQVDPAVTLLTKNYRVQESGVSWVSSQYDFLFKFEDSYTQSIGTDDLLPGWTNESVFAVEKTANFLSSGTVTGILQHSLVKTQVQTPSNLSVMEIFRNAWMVGEHATWGDLWSSNAYLLYDANHYSHLVEVTIARKVADIWTVQLGGDWIDGPSDTALGIYHDNSSYSLDISRSF